MLNSHESLKNKEWLRRRRLRLEQVRKQSNNVAKELRERMAWKDVQKTEEERKLRENEFRKQKVKALSDLERRYRSCISEIGMGHQLATAEPNVEQVMLEKNEMNLNKAKLRGESAALQQMREKKESNKIKLAHVRRKKLTRNIEDIRSNLVCSLPKNQAPLIREELQPISEQIDIQNDCFSESSCSTPRKMFLPIKGQKFSENHLKKISTKKTPKKKKKTADQATSVRNLPNSSRTKSSSLSGTKGIKSISPRSQNEQEKIWINLNDVNLPVSQDSESKAKSTRSRVTGATLQSCRENPIQVYDFPSRYYCKSYRECDSLVERIDGQSELDAVELARHDEEEKIMEENKKKENADLVAERGNIALGKEKLKREYSYLMTQLETLSKKERKAKSNRRIPPPLVHMTDERLAEMTNRKQRNMDSKFEAIYHNVMTVPTFQRHIIETDLASDKENISEESIPQLNVAWSNLKTTSRGENGNGMDDEKIVERKDKEILNEDFTEETTKYVRKKKIKQKEKKDLIQNIEKTLQKSRKIRKEATRVEEKSFGSDLSSEKSTSLEISEKYENGSSLLESSDSVEAIDSVKISIKIPEVTVKQKAQMIPRKNMIEEIGLKKPSPSKLESSNDKKQFLEYSLPLSASTCYRSPPSELHSGRIGHLINFLRDLNISQKLDKMNGNFKDDVENLVDHMSKENMEKDSQVLLNPELTYYISKLLGMSREVVANLNVSSVSEISTPYVTDIESSYNMSIFSKTDDELSGGSSQAVIGSDFSQFSSVTGEEKIRAYRLKQAEELEAKHKEWKNILDDGYEKYCKKREKKQSCVKSYEQTKTEDDVASLKKSDSNEKVKYKNDYVMRAPSPKNENKYEKITMECSQRISELSEKLEQVRKEKEKLLNSSSGNSSFSFKLEASPKKNQENREESYTKNFTNKCDGNSEKIKEKDVECFSRKKTPPALQDFTNRLSPTKAHQLSTIIEADSQLLNCKSNSSISSASNSIPNVMDELFQRNILTSPFNWSGEDTLSHISSSRFNIRKDASLLSQNLLGTEFLNEKEFRPLYFQADEFEELKFQSFLSVDSHSFDTNEKRKCINRQDETTDSILMSALDDSSLDNMNHILSKLGLKWAKPLLKKNEALNTLSTSSNSDQKVSPGSCRKLNFDTENGPLIKNHKKKLDKKS